jgi:hypothetical protein
MHRLSASLAEHGSSLDGPHDGRTRGSVLAEPLDRALQERLGYGECPDDFARPCEIPLGAYEINDTFHVVDEPFHARGVISRVR